MPSACTLDARIFEADVAVRYGLAEAILTQHMVQIICADLQMYNYQKERKKEPTIELVITGDLVWRPWAWQELSEELPWWSAIQISEIIQSCVRKGLVLQDYYNDNPFSDRMWYAVRGMKA